MVGGGFVFCSGQIAIDPKTSLFLNGSVEEQTRLALKNLTNVLSAAGSSINNVVKTTIFLASMDDFKEVNEIYSQTFTSFPPARATVAVKTLPLNALVEIDAVALLS